MVEIGRREYRVRQKSLRPAAENHILQSSRFLAARVEYPPVHDAGDFDVDILETRHRVIFHFEVTPKNSGVELVQLRCRLRLEQAREHESLLRTDGVELGGGIGLPV